MKKLLVVFALLLTVMLGTMSFSARSLSAPSINLADYPHIDLGRIHQTSLKASACADSAQAVLKQSGFGRIGSTNPGSSLFGIQGAYVAGVTWDADLHVYSLVVAGPDQDTVVGYERTLRQKAVALFEK
jgi:hypothetical protein